MFDAREEAEIKKRLADVTHPVKLVLFTQTLNCDTCPETERLVRALSELSDQLSLDVLNPHVDRDRAQAYNVQRVPTIIIEGDRDYGIRYIGAPAGYEFASLLDDIVSVGKRDSGLSEQSKTRIQELTEPLNLKVFVTPT